MTAIYTDLKNKRVFITGGGTGIGASIVEHFCEQKAEVYFIDINEKASNELVLKTTQNNVHYKSWVHSFTNDKIVTTNVSQSGNVTMSISQ